MKRPIYLIILLTVACGRERAEVSGELFAENLDLKRLVLALEAENASLRAAVMGFRPWPSTVQLKHVGGAGGLVPFIRACNAGEAVFGVRGRAGSLLDALAPVCTRLEGPKGENIETELDAAGGLGGSPFARMCPSGTYVVGIKGRAGDLVDAIELLCNDPFKQGDPAVLPTVGGTGGQAFERRCPPGFIVIGFSGRYDKQINSLSVHCGKVQVE